jgi:hypothetical protein
MTINGLYRGADKSLARPTSRSILFDGENISFDASLVIYINSTNIPPIMTINGLYRGADKSLARPTSRSILFDGENISFDASLVLYIYSTNIPPIMIINKLYENQTILSLCLVPNLPRGMHPGLYMKYDCHCTGFYKMCVCSMFARQISMV